MNETLRLWAEFGGLFGCAGVAAWSILRLLPPPPPTLVEKEVEEIVKVNEPGDHQRNMDILDEVQEARDRYGLDDYGVRQLQTGALAKVRIYNRFVPEQPAQNNRLTRIVAELVVVPAILGMGYFACHGLVDLLMRTPK